MTRINFGVHVSEGWQSPLETIMKCAGYNFLCAKRHFEHVFLNEPEIFHQGKWIKTANENVKGKAWHFVIGCVELVPVIGHIVALVERFFNKNAALPYAPSTLPKETRPNFTESTTSLQKNETHSTESLTTSPLNSLPTTLINTQKTEEIKSQEIAEKSISNNEGPSWPIPISDEVAKSPFKESFFGTMPTDPSLSKDLSDIELKALTSVQTLTKLLGLTKPLSELPKFPLKINSADVLWKLNFVEFMNSVQHPISFDFDGNGWPFIVIKVLDAKNKDIARSIFLYCGPLGSHCVQWNGWWEEHRGSSCPSFFSQYQFIDHSGNLMKYSEQTIQRFKDLVTKGEAEDDYQNKWILAL